jgi:hypothetical protein
LNQRISVVTFDTNTLISLQQIVNGENMDPGMLVQKSVEVENDPAKEKRTLRQLMEEGNVTEPTINQKHVI